uniref:Protein AHNAK2 n=1 Tax=Geotrypetes seraphini TaxID=260995 RepID=A0A6P8RU83_GEOSA|nr:protein AHNAK2 [Geotrypetes seraphini]
MCDCFHLVLPNWQGSPASGSGRPLEEEEPDGDPEDNDYTSEVAIESIRPRPQGSSPINEYPMEEDYFNKKRQEAISHKEYTGDFKKSQFEEGFETRQLSVKMSDSEEHMEVMLTTEAEEGATGFSVSGGGESGIFVQQVIKESPDSKILSIKEGDQLLSATIYFDNIKYEDALKILQYAEPYKVQFNLKRKLLKEESHLVVQSTKDKTQGKDTTDNTLGISEEREKDKVTVKRREHKPMRSKRERLSWPKFPSIKSSKILGHRRSRSTSETFEEIRSDISLASTNMESQFQREEKCLVGKKGNQNKLKFLGFKVHKRKTEDNQVSEIQHTVICETEKLAVEGDGSDWSTKLTTAPMDVQMTKILPFDCCTSADINLQKRTEVQDNENNELKNKYSESSVHTRVYPEVEISIPKHTEFLSVFKMPSTDMNTQTITAQALESTMPEQLHQTESLDKMTYQEMKPRDPDWKIQIPILQTPKFAAFAPAEKRTETEGDNTKDEPDARFQKVTSELGIESPGQEMINHTLEAQSDILSWKMPIIKMPKLPKLYTRAAKEETGLPSEENSVTKEEKMDTEWRYITSESERKMNKTRHEKHGGSLTMPKLNLPSFGELTRNETGHDDGETNKNQDRTIETTRDFDVQIRSTETEMKPSTVDFKGPKEKSITLKESLTDPKPSEIEICLLQKEKDILQIHKEPETITNPDIRKKIRRKEADIDSDKIIESTNKLAHMPKIKIPKVGFSIKEEKLLRIDKEDRLPEDNVTLTKYKSSDANNENKFLETLKSKDVNDETQKTSTPQHNLELHTTTEKYAKLQECSIQYPQFQKTESTDFLHKAKKTDNEILIVRPETDEILKAMVTDKTDTFMQKQKDKPIANESEFPEWKLELPTVKIALFTKPEITFTSTNIIHQKTEEHIQQLHEQSKELDREQQRVLENTEKVCNNFQIWNTKFTSFDSIDTEKIQSNINSKHTHHTIEEEKENRRDINDLTNQILKDYRFLYVQTSTEGKEQEPDTSTASYQTALESKEVKHSGLEGAITFPKFQMPKFGAFPYTETIAAAAPIVIAETDVIQPAVAADVEAAVAPIEASALDVKAKVPDRESESAAWKMQVPSVKLPIFTKPDLKAPTVDLSLLSTDISIAKPEVQMEEHEAETKKLTVESEITPAVIEPGTAESSFKMPKIGMPSFGLFSRKGTRGQHETESSESEAEIPGTAVKGEHQVKQPELESKEGATVVGIPSSGDLEVKEEKSKAKRFKIKMPSFHKSPQKGKGLEEDILGEPHLEGETLLPEPKEIKVLDVGVSIEAKEPQIGITEQLDEISAETKGIDFTGPEGKIVFPKFEKPKFTVLPPEPRTIDATVIIVKPEADISLPTLTADVETMLSTAQPSLDDIYAKASQGESESAEYKIQMPIVKLSQFTKPDMKAPKVDISLPSVDIATLKSEVHTQELEGQSEPLKIEGQIEPAGIKEAVGSSFKMPKLKLPSFGPFSKKGTAGQLDVQTGHGDTKITMPSTLAEAEIQLSQTQDEKADVDVDSTELEIKGKKSKIKAPKIRKPSFGSSQPRAPEVDMVVQSAEGDLSLSKPDAEAKVEITSGEKTISFDPVKAAASEVHMRLPKAELPKLESTADATLPAVDVILSKHDIPEGDRKKLPDVSALIVETVKDFRVPDMQPSTEGKELEPEVATASSQRSLESKEVKHSGLEGAITFPKLQMPKFGAFPYTETIAAAAPIAIAKTDVIQPAVAADVEAAVAPIEASALDVKAKVPDRESESAAWKMQVPSVKLPIFIKPDLKAPTVDLSLPSIDVSIAKPEVQMEEHEAETKKLTVESEITPAVIEPGMAESSFKMPKIGLPSFGLFSRKGTRGQHETESSESEAEIPGTAVEGDHQVKQPELESKEGATVGKGLEEDILGEPHLEGETLLPEPEEIKALDVGVSIEAKEPQIGITEQLDEISAETKGIDFTGPEGKIVFPKFEKPKFTVLPPEPRTIDATVIIVKPEADISLPTLTADVETTLSTAEPSLDDIHAKASQGESESAEYKIQMPIVKLSQFTKPDMKAPKVDISLPSVDIATLKSEVHTQELEGQSEPLKIEGQIEPAGIEKEAVGSSFKMPKLKLPSFGPFSKKGTAGQLDVQAGPGDTKITMPSTLAEAEIQLSQTQDEKADIDVDSTELEIKGKKSIIKAPKIRKPSFGSSQPRAPEVDMVVQSAEGDLSLSKPDAEAKVEITSGEKTISFDPVKAAASEVHMHLPKAELPKLESTADATLPAVDVILSKHDIPEGDKKKLPDVSALIVETVKDFRVPDMQPSTEGKELEPEVATASSQRSLESKEVKHSGLEGAITFPKFQMPKFGAFPYTETIAAAAPIAIAETDVIQPAVAADVEAAVAPIEASALDVKAKVPDRESESAAWKMQVPSVKLPIFTKPDLKAPTLDLSLPSIDISIAKSEVQMEEHEAETKKLTVESEITPAVIEPGMAESSFKMPKIGLPSFGLFSRKGTRGQNETESSESEAEIPGTAVEGDHQVKQPELESKEGATVVGIPSSGDLEPKFTVLPPEPRTIDATVIIVKLEADISLPTLTADVETTLSTAEPSLDDIHAKASQGESESAEYKIQMPIVKLSQFTKPDMKAPKVDISLPSVDIATLKSEVHTQELEGQSEPLKIEGQIEPAGIEKQAVGSSFKMPKLKLPSFGPFSKKGTAGQLDVQAGPGDTKITMPSTLAEAEIQLSQTQFEKADIDEDSTELEIKGKKSIIKVPKIRKPSFGSSQPRAPEVDMGVQSAEGDLSLSKPDAEAKVEITSGEKTISFDPVKAAASEVHMHLPKAELPKLESIADATLPAVDVILSKHDIPEGDRKKLPDVSALIVETVKDFRVPDMQPSTEGKELEPEVATASSQRSLESKEVKHSGLEGAITFPKLQMPKFGAFPYTETIAAAAPIAIAETDVIQPAVAADVEAAVAPIEASALDVKAKVPDRESESAAWKMQVPSKVPSKCPKSALPSFGLFSRKGTRGQHETESSESEAEIPGTAVEGDHQVKQPELESKEGATVVGIPSSGDLEVKEEKSKAKRFKIKMPSFRKSPQKGKGLEEDILGEPHLEGETLLPEPKEIKALDVGVSIEAKEPQIGITEQLDEISAETKGIDFTGPERKIVFPKFEKPKFTVLPPEPRTIDATVIIVKPEADISLPTLTADVETTLSTAEPSLDDIHAKASQGESESAEYKIQMPIVKLSQFTKPDMKAPKVDISLPSVDIATLKSEVHTQELEGQSEPLKIEGQIEPAGIEKEAVGSSFKMPKLKLPSFGPFSKKGTAGQLDVQAGPGDTKITMPSTLAEAEIQLSQTQDEKADIDVDSTELEIKGKKSIIKVPKIRKPSFGSSQPRAPEVDMGVQSAEGDLSLSKPDAEAKVEITSGEKTISFDPVKAAASEVHMRLPKAELPKLESTADATLPAVDMILSKHDIPEGDRKKLPDVSALIVETVKVFRVPDMQPSTEGKELEPEVATASSQRSLESKEVKHSGLEGAITFPKLQMPKFGAFPYTETIAAAAPIAIAETDVIQPAVAADVEAAVAPIEASALDVKAKVPDRESESATWKMQVPSVKLPIFTKPDLKAPTIDLSLPSIDVSIAKPEVQMEEHEAETKKLTVESEITPAVIEPGMAESSFKMPKIGMPSFGLFSRKGTRGQHETESSESEAEIPGTAVEGDHQVKQPELESKEGATVVGIPSSGDLEVKEEKSKAKRFKIKIPSFRKSPQKGKGLEEDILGEPHLEGETLLPEPKEIKALDVGVSIEAKEPQIGITEQLDEISAETKGIDFTGPEGKIVFPKFEKPKFTVLPPEPRMIDASVIIVKPEADISLPTLTADVETTLSTAEPSLDDIHAKASQGESESAEYKIQMPIVKLSQFTKPDMKAPKVDISLPSVDIATLKSEVHTQELEGQSEPLKIEGQIEPAGIEKAGCREFF